MPLIHVLQPHIANQIAAGEVVERPASIVKELVENAVDAHATLINIEIENGGVDRILIADNGTGIADEDCETAFLRHATSKIQHADDLSHIATLGFRGEALASIAAVSRVTLTTRTAGDDLGTLLRYEGGELKEHRRIGCPVGTSIAVTDLFYNVPARRKFLKSSRAESGAVGDTVARLLLSLPQVAFHFVNAGKTVYQTSGDGSLKNALVAVYGVQVAPHLCEVIFDDGYMKITGFVGTPELSRVNRTGQLFFLNRRLIRSNALSAALSRAFDTRLLIGRYPFAVLSLEIALAEVDVNVHPAKLEVRFVDEQRVTRSVCVACSEALLRSYVPTASTDTVANAPLQREEAPGGEAPARVILRKQAEQPREYTMQESPAYFKTPPYEPSAIPRYTVRMPEQAQVKREQATLFTRSEAPFSIPYKVIGVAFETYWFVQQGETVYCIDQHAAHERLLFDALTEKRAAIVSQALLMPEEITLLPSDYALFCERSEALTAFGFVFSECDNNRIILAAVPQVNGIPLKSAFLLDTLHEAEIGRAKLMQTACKHAVKAGEPITAEELKHLLAALAENDTLLTCPHGRPVAVRFTKLAIEKMFKRVL